MLHIVVLHIAHLELGDVDTGQVQAQYRYHMPAITCAGIDGPSVQTVTEEPCSNTHSSAARHPKATWTLTLGKNKQLIDAAFPLP